MLPQTLGNLLVDERAGAFVIPRFSQQLLSDIRNAIQALRGVVNLDGDGDFSLHLASLAS